MKDDDQFPTPVMHFPGDPITPPVEVSDFVLRQAFAGLLIPNAETLHSIYRELRKWRGDPNPDLI